MCATANFSICGIHQECWHVIHAKVQRYGWRVQETKKLTGNVMAAIKTMAVVDQANQLGRVLPPEAFYNELIRCCSCCPLHCNYPLTCVQL